MATSDARTPDEYIAALPDDRREAVSAVRDVVCVDLESFVASYEKALGSSRTTRGATGAGNP